MQVRNFVRRAVAQARKGIPDRGNGFLVVSVFGIGLDGADQDNSLFFDLPGHIQTRLEVNCHFGHPVFAAH